MAHAGYFYFQITFELSGWPKALPERAAALFPVRLK